MKIPYTKSKNPVVILKHVIKAIEADPLRYNQWEWLFHRSPNSLSCPYLLDIRRWPACGTIGCVAGWVKTVTGARGRPETAAQRVLGLTANEAHVLFDPHVAGEAPRTRGHVRRGVRHIRRFMNKTWNAKGQRWDAR